MKTILLALICLICAKASVAQKELLSFDEHNKYIYYQVNNMRGITADSLHARGLNFLKSLSPKIKIANSSAGLTGKGRFLTYGGVSVLRHESGEIDYLLTIEFKDQRYRYWLTGFTFTPYKRDRYGNFVSEQGIEIPLEALVTKLNNKEAESCLTETGAFCKQFGESLKQYLMKAPIAIKKEENAKKTVTDKW